MVYNGIKINRKRKEHVIMPLRINKNLDLFADFDPTKESKPISISNLCKDIDEGKLSLPIFQTYIRWQLEKSVALLNFQLFGKAAVSPISINVIENTEKAVPQVSFIDRKLMDDGQLIGKHSVNDGQQRLSCNYKAYINHEDFKCIVLDISKGKFLINKEKIRNSQIPVGVLYNKDPEVFKNYIKKRKHLQDFEVNDLLRRVRLKHLSYYYTVNYARDLSEEEQREWFEVLNLAGSRVSQVQVNLTEMLIKGVDYYREYAEPFIDRLKDANMEHLFAVKTTQISVPLAMLNSAYEVQQKDGNHTANFSPIPSDAKAGHISKLSSGEIRELFKLTLDGLDKAIKFIEQNSLDIPKRIDYITYLTGALVFNGDKDLNKNQIQYLIDWYNEVVFELLGNGERREVFAKIIKVKDM